MMRWAVVLVAMAGCAPSEDPEPEPAKPPVTDTAATDSGSAPVDTGTPVDTGGDTASVTSTGCTLPPPPTDFDYLPHVPPSEDFAFDDQGNLVNIDDGLDALIRTPFSGSPELLAPYSSPEVAGIAFLLDGDIAVADEGTGALNRLGLDGAKSLILGSIDQPNSVTIDTAGQIYTTAFDDILRVDPVTGASTVIYRFPGLDLDGLTFSADYQTLYFNYDEDSVVGKIELDTYGEVVAVTEMVNLPEFGGGELNGMTIDECGNLYAIATDGSLFRVFPDGTAELLLTFSGPGLVSTTAVRFGSGIGGWEEDHLYVMNRYGGLFDVDLGIKGRKEPHLP